MKAYLEPSEVEKLELATEFLRDLPWIISISIRER
jgi:hypothetical protein